MKLIFSLVLLLATQVRADSFFTNSVDGDGFAEINGDLLDLNITGTLTDGGQSITLSATGANRTSKSCSIPSCTIANFADGWLTITSDAGDLQIHYADDPGDGNFNEASFIHGSGNFFNYIFQMRNPIGIVLASGIFEDVWLLQYFTVDITGTTTDTGFEFSSVALSGPFQVPEPATWLFLGLAIPFAAYKAFKIRIYTASI